MSRFPLKARTALALGLPNLWRVSAYRLGVKLGINPVRRIRAHLPDGDFFAAIPACTAAASPGVYNGCAQAGLPPPARRWWNRQDYFGWFQVDDPSIPCWHTNALTGARISGHMRPWWEIPDFDTELGDIKTVWEASRFDWVLTFAEYARAGNPAALDRLNAWLTDWATCNPPYRGPNWKCGQEASIRVMHLATASLLLDQHQRPTPLLRAFIEAHLLRIAPTIGYAIAQDNNHGTSEAAGLFIGGSWLAAVGSKAGERWAQQGRAWLENRAARLIADDGSFSQYSLNYHRLMLDTYSLAEHWRRCLALTAFSSQLYSRLALASRWLYSLTQADNGDAPNLGANDGARLLPLGDTDYRDYRPSVQLAMALFSDRCAYAGDGGWNLPLRWLGIPIPKQGAEPVVSTQFGDGGYSLLRRGRAFVLLRFPRFRFRPSQADALHLDLWVGGENRLRDAGTYSYNVGDEALGYFGGTAGHNTVQFDDRDQMPRLGRFLFGDWLEPGSIIPVTQLGDGVIAAAGYTDGKGASHHRRVWLTATSLRVDDAVSGFTRRAVLRWRLLPGDWRLEGETIRLHGDKLRVTASVPITRRQLSSGWESRYYHRRESVPVLEVEIRQAGRFTSVYQFLR